MTGRAGGPRCPVRTGVIARAGQHAGRQGAASGGAGLLGRGTSLRALGAARVCRPRPNGSTPPGTAWRRPTIRGTGCQRVARQSQCLSGPGGRFPWSARSTWRNWDRGWSQAFRPPASDCTTRPATSGNGPPTATGAIVSVSLRQRPMVGRWVILPIHRPVTPPPASPVVARQMAGIFRCASFDAGGDALLRLRSAALAVDRSDGAGCPPASAAPAPAKSLHPVPQNYQPLVAT